MPYFSYDLQQITEQLNFLCFLWDIKMHPQNSQHYAISKCSILFVPNYDTRQLLLIHTCWLLHIEDTQCLMNEWNHGLNLLYYKTDVFHSPSKTLGVWIDIKWIKSSHSYDDNKDSRVSFRSLFCRTYMISLCVCVWGGVW